MSYVIERLLTIHRNGGVRGLTGRCVWVARKAVHEARLNVRYAVAPVRASDADPFKVIRIPTAAIREEFVLPKRGRYKEPGRVHGGPWDRLTLPYEEKILYQSFVDHFRNGTPWEDTWIFKLELHRLRPGRTVLGCATREELEARYRKLDALYETLNRDGYRPQGDLRGDKDPEALAMNEIGVSVARDGRFIGVHEGQHRLALAKLIGIPEVPVHVRVRHTGWQAIRDEVRNAASLDALGARARAHLGHPDLADVVPPAWLKRATEGDDARAPRQTL